MQHIYSENGQRAFRLDSLCILMTSVLTLSQRRTSDIRRNSLRNIALQGSPNSLNVWWYTVQLDMICTLFARVTTKFPLGIQGMHPSYNGKFPLGTSLKSCQTLFWEHEL
jgi:hypothetical protein